MTAPDPVFSSGILTVFTRDSDHDVPQTPIFSKGIAAVALRWWRYSV